MIEASVEPSTPPLWSTLSWLAASSIIAVPLSYRATAWLRGLFGERLRPLPPPHPGLAETGLLALFLFLLAGGIAPHVVNAISPLEEGAPLGAEAIRVSLVVTNLTNLIVVALILLFARRRHQLSPSECGIRPLRSLAPYGFAIGALVLFAPAYVSVGLFNQLAVDALGWDTYQIYVEHLLDDATFRSDPRVLFLMIVAVPLLEEALFRGFIQRGLRCVVPPVGAIVITSVLFASVHDPQSALPVFVVGLALGVIAEATGSILPSTFAHALFNGGMILSILIPS